MKLTDDITNVKGIGEKSSKLFHRLNIYNIRDLLWHFPRDYDEWKDPVFIENCQPNITCAIAGTISGTPVTRRVNRLTITTFNVEDATGCMKITFFNMPYLAKSLVQDKYYIFRGIPVLKGNMFSMDHPTVFKPEEYIRNCGILQPIYPTTAGLTQKAITKAVEQVLKGLEAEEYLPESIKEKYHLEDYIKALKILHFPKSRDDMIHARRRFVFEEFFLFILSVMALKKWNENQKTVNPMIIGKSSEQLIENLPYSLTSAQKKVWIEIQKDLTSNHLMNRLVQGDVGSGKTIVAILAILMCVDNHKQTAFMAPTEVLAKQHYETLLSLKETYHLPIEPVLLVGSLTAKQKREAYAEIVTGEKNVIIGTSALIQEKVIYQDLALVITDEQHRFGVKQRETLAQKGMQTHVLVMSATPIPRTLALILYGDLDISVMNEMPANRLPIKNCVVGTNYRKTAYNFMEKQIQEGRQIYIICPMVEKGEGDMEALENVLDYTETLKTVFPPYVRIRGLHGQMKPKEKNEIMEQFGAREIDILVSTTVIEVGINVPNATVMMIENAERFGLAQLHQLRGRVGRGNYQSYCIFMAGNQGQKTMERLDVLNKSNDGFFISSEDMRLRGPGDLFGIRQSGVFQFQVGDVYQDANILQEAQTCAEAVFLDYKERKEPEFTPLWNYFDSILADNIDFIGI